MSDILIPTPLRAAASGADVVVVDANTVGEALRVLTTEHPRLQPSLFDEQGNLRRFVNLFVNGEDIRMTGGLATEIGAMDRIQIVPAIAGGSGAGKSFAELRAELQSKIGQIEPAALQGIADCIIIDVRSESEWRTGHLPSARHVDRGFLELEIERLEPDRSRTIVCYCASGTRSLLAADTLTTMGYANVRSLSGGIEGWKAIGGRIVAPAHLSEAEALRYKRQLSIPEVGIEGQLRLAESRVLVIGMGGLGCPSALYLAAAGVGFLGLVDDDRVDVSNLHRQVLYTDSMIGEPKVLCAEQVLRERAPALRTEIVDKRLDEQAAASLFPDYDVIVDATDNFRSRYLINDVAAGLGKPVVHGSVYRFSGQVGVFWAGRGPCYRCLYPEAPPPELAPSCAEGGVLGVVPGLVGLGMAAEAIKLLLGIGSPLLGRVASLDVLGGSQLELRFATDPHCSACGAIAEASQTRRQAAPLGVR